MKKYFKYDYENISGWCYWWRMLWQSFLIPLFGLGFYLQGITIYKRAKSLSLSNGISLFLAIQNIILLVIIFLQSQSESEVTIWNILFTIPHWYLWFSNQINREKKISVLMKKLSRLKLLKDKPSYTLESKKIIEQDIYTIEQKISKLNDEIEQLKENP